MASVTFSVILAICVGILTLIIPLLIYMIIRNGQNKLIKESFKQKYQSLFAYLNPANKNMIGIILWSYGKRIIYVVILVLFSALDLSGVQTILLAILAFLVEFHLDLLFNSFRTLEFYYYCVLINQSLWQLLKPYHHFSCLWSTCSSCFEK